MLSDLERFTMSKAVSLPTVWVLEFKSLPLRMNNRVVAPAGEWEVLVDDPLSLDHVAMFFRDTPDDEDFLHRARNIKTGAIVTPTTCRSMLRAERLAK